MPSVPFTTNYPTAVDDATSLGDAANRFATTLQAPGLTAGATSMTVASTTGAPTSGALTVDSEEIYYTGKTGTTFTGLLRGQDGSVAASHNVGATVEGRILAAHHKALRAAIIATQTKVDSLSGNTVNPVFSGETVRMENDNTTPSMPYSLIVDQATTNLLPNPSAETNTTGWSGYNGGTLSRVADAWIGGNCFQLAVGASVQSYGIATDYITGISAGTYYTFQARLKIPGGTGNKRVRVGIEFFTTLNASTGRFTSYEARRPIDDWDRHFCTAVAPASSVKCKVFVENYPDALDVGSYNVRFDGCQLEAKPYPSSYADGSMGPGYAWTGTAHASTSTRTAGLKYFQPTADKSASKPAFPFVLSSNGMIEGDFALGRYHPNWDPLQGHSDNSQQGPRDFWYDAQHKKLHARSLLLFEMGDPVDLALHRFSDGIENFPDGNPGNAANAANGLAANTPLGTIYWRGWQGSGNGGFSYRSAAIYARVRGGALGATVYGALYFQTARNESGCTDSMILSEGKHLHLAYAGTGPTSVSGFGALWIDAGVLKFTDQGGVTKTITMA